MTWQLFLFSSFHLGVIQGEKQRPSSLIIQEGDNSTLQCNFSASVTSVQWFLQNPGGRLINLFYIPSGTKHNGRLMVTALTKECCSLLNVSSSQTTDFATYICAVEPRYSPGSCSPYINHQLPIAPPQLQILQGHLSNICSSMSLTHIGRGFAQNFLPSYICEFNFYNHFLFFFLAVTP
uniref:Ig-like domain-containing protein n=1 Tax=Castor canadensis TaxID=51338 RepID=A0A8C0W355_CASCN